MKMLPLTASLVIAVLTVADAPAARAAGTLDIYASRAPVAAAQVAEKYGVNIELRGEFRRRVTFHVGDADSPGARLDAVNTLANALNADFVKMYVVTKSDGDAPVQALVDATARIPFTQTSLSAPEAIARIADADYALARIDGVLDGSVTLSASKLTVAQAMTEIAAQTHTAWKTVYILTPRGAQLAVDQTVIGRTASGAPILQMAKIIYDDPARDARQALARENARKQAEQQRQQALAAQKQASTQQTASNPVANGGTTNGNTPAGYGANPQQYPYNAPNSYPSAYNSGSGMIIFGAANTNGPIYIGPGR
jgi:hypothetical protein